jgi:[acyl-carrier-protein] S-malonyltransferase
MMTRAWIFPGQGAQFVGMAADLAERFVVARDTLAEADEALGFELSALMAEGPIEKLTLTTHTQPAILAHSVAVLRLLKNAGIDEPVAVAGHSLGEYSALVCAGALSFADALRIVQKRGRFMQEAVPAGLGTMAAVIGLESQRVTEVCEQLSNEDALVCAANFNDPTQTVIAGHKAAVEAAMPVLKEAGARRVLSLPVSAPFHCSLMSPVQKRLDGELQVIDISDPRLPVIANVDALAHSKGMHIRHRLVEQVCAPVRWVDCVHALRSAGASELLELGPGRALAGMVRRIDKTLPTTSLGNADQLTAFLESAS